MNEGSTSKVITASIHVATVGLGLAGGFHVAEHPVLGWLAIGGALLCGLAALCRGWVLEEENAELVAAYAPTPVRAVGPLPPPRVPSSAPRCDVTWGPSRHSVPKIPLPVLDADATESWTDPRAA